MESFPLIWLHQPSQFQESYQCFFFFLTMSLNPSAVPPVVFIINFDHALYETEHYLLLSCF